MNRFFLWLVVPIFLLSCYGTSQQMTEGKVPPWSTRIVQSFIALFPDTIAYTGVPKSKRWDYERGVVLQGVWQVYHSTGDEKFLAYIKKNIDQFVDKDGSIKTYEYSTFNLDNIATGRQLLALYNVTGNAKYKKAADILRKQLAHQPRTNEGGFWHKKIYPYQMWLDGLYMGAPFYAEYARMFNEPNAFDDITSQFLFIDKHTRDSSTGLLFHAWDESKQQKWANPETGVSPCFWGRAMGWYMWAIVDVLDYLPLDHPKRAELIEILQRESAALLKYREPHSGLWYQVLDQGNRAGNYLESSASCMFVYAFAKGANKGYLDISYGTVAQKSFKGILDSMLTVDEKGLIFLHHTCQGAGLGGIPYRDGSYEYYIHEKQRTNDFKAIGPFILAALELEKKYKPLENKLVPIQTENSVGEGKVVGLDYFFNNEWRLNKDSVLERWHYTWEDTTNSGFSILGRSIDLLGAHLDALQSIPTDLSLRRLSIYIIVDPDTPLETKNPNYISKEAINAIIPWVEKGGVLVLMGNDKGNSEFENFNKLAEHFGIHFNEDCYHKVLGRNFETGKSDHLPAHPIFKNVKQIFMKEICSLRIEKPAEPILTENNLVFMASARVGKGMVFAVGDPWFYNEYMDTRRLPIDYENSTAGRNLFQWLLSNADSSVH